MTLCIFQLTCLLALGHCCTNNLTVRQTPKSAHLKEGASVNFSCTFTPPEDVSVDVDWYYGTSSKISFQRFNTSGSRDFTSVLPFHSVQRNQSGTYFCNVTILIPCYERGAGSGTSLTVEPEVLRSPGTVSSLPVVGTSLLVVVLTVGICCVIYWKRKGNKRTASTRQETDCATPVPSEVVYAKVNIMNSSACDRRNRDQAQYCNNPEVGKRTLDSGCWRPAVEEHVLYSTLKSAAPDL